MNSSLRVLANCIDLINLHLQMTVGAHIVRPFSVLHRQNRAPMAIFHKQRNTKFCEKNAFAEKFCFQYNKYVKTTVYIVFCVFHQQNRRNGHEAD